MITYIPHGGKTSIQNEKNDGFFAQFTELVKKDVVTILLCYFSREKEKWESMSSRDMATIKRVSKKKVEFLIAENTEDLISKLEVSDVLFVAGGEANLIEPQYAAMSKIHTMLDGKIYAGSSMGAFFASESYVLSLERQDDGKVHKGSGFLPVQMLCHFNIDEKKDKKIQMLAAYSKSPIIALNECEYTIFYS